MRNQIVFQWILPLSFLLLFAPFSEWIDLNTSSFFYLGNRTFVSSPYLDFLFKYGEKLGFVVAGVALIIFLYSLLRNRWVKWRLSSLFMVLAILLGPGLLVNVVMKQFWGRPRPVQIEEFGGKAPFRPFWAPRSLIKPNYEFRSFPSGHSAMGFYYLAFIFIGKRERNKTITYTGVGLTTFWGGSLMIARVMQCAHFVSDVIASPILMFWVFSAIEKALYGNHRWSIKLRKHLLSFKYQRFNTQRTQ
jgi:lipid A 4'-phosphatase